jgi:retinol dehydrogenase-12
MNTQPMAGKTVLITGATAGIGLATARGLARKGATLVLVGRSPQRLEETETTIRRETGNPNISGLLADLSSQAQVRRLAEEFLQRNDRLDVLINNAGSIFIRRMVSADGIEMTLALNHLAYFLLTNLLLERLKESAPSRIINVASNSHEGKSLLLDDLEMKNGYSGRKQYGHTKLMNILFTYELARRLEGSGVTVNALHPGFVATSMGRDNRGVYRLAIRLAQLVAMPPAEGAQTSIYLAASPQVAGVTGKYFVRSQPTASTPQSMDKEAARSLWEISLKMTGLG